MAQTADPIVHPQVIPYGPTFAAEIRGIDFTRPVDAGSVSAIHRALMAYKVLFFRDVEMTPEQHVALGRRFGELTVHPFSAHLEHLPEVLVLDNDAENPVFATDVWHSDETFRIDPPMGTILRCITIPERGGDTVWADMAAAFAGLSDKMQHFLSGLEAVHDFIPFRRKFDGLPARERHERLAAMEEELPNPTHPVVTTHPATGQRILFVNPQFTVRIKGMRDDESRALLAFLFQQATIPEYQFRFHWAPNSMVFWDNRGTQHYAVNDYLPSRRTMQRVTIKAERSKIGAPS
ncbi:MAG: TauD/TfdA family dioxygenase [Candidatus Lustribacter sp.]